MKYLLLFAAMFITLPCFAQKVYKHTDESGKTYYTDEEVEGAKEIQLPPIQIYTAPEAASPVPANETPGQEGETEEIPIEYKIAIIQPANDYVMQTGVEELEVIVFIEPKLQDNHVLQMLVDDIAVGGVTRNLSFILKDLSRGTHVLQVRVRDKKDKEKIISESEPITIHVHRPIVRKKQ